MLILGKTNQKFITDIFVLSFNGVIILSNLLDSINDVFVISTSGVPYYATCFAGPICKMKPDHLLQSGFIVAMFSFAKEFGQKSIIHVEFEEGLMVFAYRKLENEEILIVFYKI